MTDLPGSAQQVTEVLFGEVVGHYVEKPVNRCVGVKTGSRGRGCSPSGLNGLTRPHWGHGPVSIWRRDSVLKSGTAQSRPISRRRLSTNPPRHGHSDQWRSHGSICRVVIGLEPMAPL
jgi:hypothetical protein